MSDLTETQNRRVGRGAAAAAPGAETRSPAAIRAAARRARLKAEKEAAPAPPQTRQAAKPRDELADLYRADSQVEREALPENDPQWENQIEGDDEPTQTRRTRTEGSGNWAEIPDKYRRPGWDYEYKTSRVNGADVDSSELSAVYEQGWRPVLARSMPDLVGPGYAGKHVQRYGQILYTRPMTLTSEARAEDYAIAETQKQDKLQAASAVPTARPGLINPFKNEMTIEGVVGVHRKSA